MASPWRDQAAGLRALIAPSGCRSVSLCGGRGGIGTTTIAIHLAAALAERQREIILLDEYHGLSNTAHRLRLPHRYDFENAIRREVSLADTLLTAPAGFSILPVSARPQTLAALNERELAWLGSEFEALTSDADFLLLDTRPATGPGIPSLSLAADDVVVIVSERAESLTDAYATIKLLYTEYARCDFRILVNRVDNLTEANFLFQRIKRVAHDYLGAAVQLRLIGFVPEDPLLKRATRLGKIVFDAFPDAESGHAFRQLADAMLRWRQPTTGSDKPANFVYRLVESSRILTDHMHY